MYFLMTFMLSFQNTPLWLLIITLAILRKANVNRLAELCYSRILILKFHGFLIFYFLYLLRRNILSYRNICRKCIFKLLLNNVHDWICKKTVPSLGIFLKIWKIHIRDGRKTPTKHFSDYRPIILLEFCGRNLYHWHLSSLCPSVMLKLLLWSTFVISTVAFSSASNFCLNC